MRRKPFFTKPFAWKSMAAAAVVAAAAGIATPAAATYVKAGVLTCNVGPSVGLIITQRKDMTCTFSPNSGGTEHYNGTLRKFGLAVGVTGQGVIVWAVLSAVSGIPPRGALAGDYGGASAEASVVVGVGANILVGGSNSTFALQPLSVEGQIGLDFAVGISSLALTSTP